MPYHLIYRSQPEFWRARLVELLEIRACQLRVFEHEEWVQQMFEEAAEEEKRSHFAVELSKEMAIDLEQLVNAYLDDIDNPVGFVELREYLWDNKIGILRICEELARRK
jgi:hypothetical protein